MFYKRKSFKTRVYIRFIQSPLLFLALLIASTTNAQNNVTVNHSTGTPNVNIPFFTVRSGSLNMPVGIVYNSSGIKVKQIEGLAGMGWNLYAGGEVSRDVKGLPDDCKKNVYGQDRVGWLYNSNGTLIKSFIPANDGNLSTCQDEAADLSYMATSTLNTADNEPDIFYVSAPGLSLKLVFDQNHNLVTIPYQDIKAEYATGIDGSITSFTLTNDEGVRYLFSEAETASKIITSTGGNAFFFTDYTQYNGQINYNSSWKLKSMTDMTGNTIVLNYLSATDAGASLLQKHGIDPIIISQAGPSGTSVKSKLYDVEETFTSKWLTKIQTGNSEKLYDALTFVNGSSASTGVPLVREIQGYGRTIKLTFADANFSGLHGNYNRQFLGSVASMDKSLQYTFKYTGTVAETNGFNYIPLPDSSSKEIDLWGYYNGSGLSDLTPQTYVNPSNPSMERYRNLAPANATTSYPYILGGSDRKSNASFTAIGTLSRIENAAGGSTSLEYEPNDYYDPTAAMVVQGAGVRIKRLISSDGLGTGNDMVTNYNYLSTSTGITSGKPISLPIFAFTTNSTVAGTEGDVWNNATARSESDLSKEDHTIIYGQVRESISGAGSTLYEFSTPATNWDAANGDWTPGINFSARADCQTSPLVGNGRDAYPFIPRTNFDFERGLLKKVTNFNENGTVVSESNYSYQRSGIPVVIDGLRLDNNNGLTSYGKYSILASVDMLVSDQKTKTFDTQTLTKAMETTSHYYYDGLSHRQPTRLQRNNSDGTTTTNYTRYIKDYPVSSASDVSSLGIRALGELNFNVPVEQYTEVLRDGIAKVTKAKLTKFASFNTLPGKSVYLPAQQMTIINANGISGFQPSSTATGVFTNDPSYFVTENVLSYDFTGLPLSKDDNNRNVKTVLTDHEIFAPVLTATRARADEIATNDFDSELSGVRFIKISGSPVYSSNARTGGRSITLSPGEALSASVNKSQQAETYVFSLWVNAASNGNISISVNSSAGTSAYTLPYSGTNNWKYYEVNIPVSAISGNFTAQISAGNAVLIDDMLLYPQDAEITTAGYDRLTRLKTSETNSNGVSNYFTYDAAGRVRYVYNQDKEIVLKKTYVTKRDQEALNDFTVSINSTVQKAGTPISFSATSYLPPVSEGISYLWSFGDGSSSITTSSNTASHTYQVAGTYTLTVTVTSPTIGQKTTTLSVVVNPDGVHISYSNLTGGLQRISSITFSQGGVQKYLFNTAQIQAGQNILQGIYSVKVIYLFGDETTVLMYYGNGSALSKNGASPWNFTIDATLLSNLNFVIQ